MNIYNTSVNQGNFKEITSHFKEFFRDIKTMETLWSYIITDTTEEKRGSASKYSLNVIKTKKKLQNVVLQNQ
jgi:hypothetical protein